MPILDVEIVASSPDAIAPPLAQTLADTVAPLLGAAPGRVWVKLRRLPRAHYAENESPRDETSPVFVKLLQRSPPVAAERKKQVARLTPAIAAACGRDPSCVHIFYESPAAGRASFGGTLIDDIE